MTLRSVLLLLLGVTRAWENVSTLVRGHGFSFVASAAPEVGSVPVAEWSILGPDGDRQSRRFKAPSRVAIARCDRAVVRLFIDPIWGCGRRSAAARAHAKGQWIACGVDAAPDGSTVSPRGRTKE